MNAPARSHTSPISPTLAADGRGLLLVAGPSEEVAKRIESFLRNAGHPLRCAWVDDASEVEDILRRSPPDLLLCDDSAGQAQCDRLLKTALELRPDLPVLILSREPRPGGVVQALEHGARDLLGYGDAAQLRQLELVVIREFLGHQHLRRLRVMSERLHDFEQRHSQLLETTADAVAHVQEGILAHANPSFAKLLGYENPEALQGEPLIDFVVADQRTRVKERLRLVLKGKHAGEPLEFSFEGKEHPVPVSAQLVVSSEDGERVIQMIIRSDTQPGLTPSVVEGTLVANPPPASASVAPSNERLGFLHALSASERSGQPRGALLLTVDGFSALEDRFGLADSESLLEQLRQALKARLAPADQVFRYAAGELAAVVGRPRLADIQSLGELLQRELSQQIYTTAQHEAQLTLSLVAYPLAGDEKAEAVVREIQRESRRLSQKGGNQFAVLGAAAEASQSEREDARKAAMVKKAIEENRLKLAYQSIASLEGDSRQHFDVLVRMIDDTGKELHAGEFLPAAAKFNLMRNVDRWVIARSLAIIAKRAGGKDIPSLFVRLSEDSLRETDDFLKWLTELLKAHPLQNEELVFEIQEMVLQNHIRKAKTLTETLAKLGASIAVDHYGMSSNSAQMLEHLPNISYLKFHSSYTQKFNEKEVNRRMSQLMEVAKQKKIKTIVSHVEDANVMARLWQMGVNYIQGYHVQEPEVVLLASEFITKAKSIHAPR
ncbi:EAL domain-containing protein [Stagnimonas aquatica]|uniref:EAL domain-containing protein n=1 Tax=Stagnimonas aquatica TaxID=2689987 RepID=A0A3N0VDJ8_9GAMM|nr:EAL domain-containing protein [Stagnimonas aquatica]ROH90853.1 EAL domain-containing protein [Stagnimonas aquatica]